MAPPTAVLHRAVCFQLPNSRRSRRISRSVPSPDMLFVGTLICLPAESAQPKSATNRFLYFLDIKNNKPMHLSNSRKSEFLTPRRWLQGAG
jgi:hypothetical protein